MMQMMTVTTSTPTDAFVVDVVAGVVALRVGTVAPG